MLLTASRFHAARAVTAWETVIQRTGVSKFPIAQAQIQLKVAKALLEKANAVEDWEMVDESYGSKKDR